MDHQKIFYTNLFVIDDFIPTSTNAEKERIEGMKKYISDLWSKRDYDDNWQTKSANLHKQKEFKFFADLILSLLLVGAINGI